jgi:hypothetical protein
MTARDTAAPRRGVERQYGASIRYTVSSVSGGRTGGAASALPALRPFQSQRDRRTRATSAARTRDARSHMARTTRRRAAHIGSYRSGCSRWCCRCNRDARISWRSPCCLMTTLVASWFSLVRCKGYTAGHSASGSHPSSGHSVQVSSQRHTVASGAVEPDVTYSAGGPISILAP